MLRTPYRQYGVPPNAILQQLHRDDTVAAAGGASRGDGREIRPISPAGTTITDELAPVQVSGKIAQGGASRVNSAAVFCVVRGCSCAESIYCDAALPPQQHLAFNAVHGRQTTQVTITVFTRSL